MRVVAGLFGVLMSVNPVLAALMRTLFLHEGLKAAGWVAIAIIVANAVTTIGVNRRARA